MIGRHFKAKESLAPESSKLANRHFTLRTVAKPADGSESKTTGDDYKGILAAILAEAKLGPHSEMK